MKTSIIMCFLGILCFGCNHNSVGPGPNPVPNPNTAAYKLRDVDSAADSYGKGLKLMSIYSQNVNLDGTSNMWSYQYSDTSTPPTSYFFHSTSSTV